MSGHVGLTANTSKRRGVRKLYVVSLACAALVTLAVGYSRERKRVDVKVTSPAYQDIETTVSAQGTVVPFNDFQARANFSGMVDKIYVHVGEKVHAGQALIRMRDQYAVSRVVSARAALEAAEVNQDNVQMSGSQEDRIGFAADLVRAQTEQKSAADALFTVNQLEAKGSASEAEVLAATQRLQNASAALSALKQRMSGRYSPADIASWKSRVNADRASLAAEKTSYDNANMASPISGTVYLIPVTVYDFVPMGAELLHVADLSKIRIRADFYEQDVGMLQLGQPVRITWEGNSNRTWHGRISAKPLALTRSGALSFGRCTIEINDAKGELPVNTNVTAIVTVAKHTHVLTIPREALHSEGSTHFVYRVENGKLLQTPVTIGLVNPLRAEINSGITSKDTVVLHAANDEKLSNGLKVEIVK
jgi:HlyD family secretion protein